MSGRGRNGGGEVLVATNGCGPDFAGARAAVEDALRRVDALGRAVFDQPGNRDDVARLLRGARGGLFQAAGAIEEAHGVNGRVDLERRAITG